MSSRLQWLMLQVSRRLWFRVSLLSALAVATGLLAIVVAPYIPPGISASVGADAVGDILAILATSMLAVTIFSLNTMVTAYNAASSNVSPRAIRLLVEDATAHNALGTFVGAFLFSLVGLIALRTGLYGSQERLVLFIATVAMIVFVVMTLLHWIDHVSTLGQVAETTHRIEKAAARAIAQLRDKPHLDGTPRSPDAGLPADAFAVHSERIGYVQHVDVSALSELAGAHEGASIHLDARPGAFVDPSVPLAWVVGVPSDETVDEVRLAFTIEELRSFDQDPRFGLMVMSEIASRALSPAINDPGTAIDVLGRGVRLLAMLTDPPLEVDQPPQYPQVHVPGIPTGALFDDLYHPIARHGAGIAEVGIRLQKSLLALARLGGDEFARNARRHSALALERALVVIGIEDDRERLRRAAAAVDAAATTAATDPARYVATDRAAPRDA